MKRFKGGFALGPIDVEIKRGQITGVVGENGNGKTTFFRVVVGELAQDEGSLAYPFLGQADPNINWHNVKSNIAYVPQELPRWYGSLRENLDKTRPPSTESAERKTSSQWTTSSSDSGLRNTWTNPGKSYPAVTSSDSPWRALWFGNLL